MTKHRFEVVIGVVGRDEPARPALLLDAAEEAVAGDPGCGLGSVRSQRERFDYGFNSS